jgi:hypothetical protein
MKIQSRDAALFFAGVAASETLGHWWLGLSGKLPMDLGWFTLGRGLNMGAMIAWPIVLVGLLFCAFGV